MRELLMPLLDPVALLWVLLLLWGCLQLKRRKWGAAWFPLLTAVMLGYAGASQLSDRLLADLERPYARGGISEVPTADVVVMLGGMVSTSCNDPFGFQVRDTLDRFLTAVEVVRAGKAPVLVLGGGGHPGAKEEISEGEYLARWMCRWGMTNAPVYLLGSCKNTRDEAERTAHLAQEKGWQRVLLVTSAAHMSRSEATFRKVGLAVHCVACDFKGMSGYEEPRLFTLFPSSSRLADIATVLHEWAGGWVYRLRGWI